MARERRQRRYSDEERSNVLAALVANGGNVERTSREMGVPNATIREWRAGNVPPGVAESRDEKLAPLADAFELIARRCLGGMTDEKIAEADAVALMKSAGIAVDKMRLLREQPTEITKSDGDLDVRIDRYADAFLAAARREEGGDLPGDGAGQPVDP